MKLHISKKLPLLLAGVILVLLLTILVGAKAVQAKESKSAAAQVTAGKTAVAPNTVKEAATEDDGDAVLGAALLADDEEANASSTGSKALAAAIAVGLAAAAGAIGMGLAIAKSAEGISLTKVHLSEEGLSLLNMVSAVRGPFTFRTRHIRRRFSDTFRHTLLLQADESRSPYDIQNCVLFASGRPLTPDEGTP